MDSSRQCCALLVFHESESISHESESTKGKFYESESRSHESESESPKIGLESESVKVALKLESKLKFLNLGSPVTRYAQGTIVVN